MAADRDGTTINVGDVVFPAARVTAIDGSTVVLRFRPNQVVVTDSESLVSANVGSGAPASVVNPVFTIWAEENSTLNASGTEWAYGNGANTPADRGVVLGVASQVIAMTLSVGGTTPSASVELLKNGSATGETVSVSSANSGSATFGSGTTFAVGDVLNFRTVTASGTASPAVVTAWLERTA